MPLIHPQSTSIYLSSALSTVRSRGVLETIPALPVDFCGKMFIVRAFQFIHVSLSPFLTLHCHLLSLSSIVFFLPPASLFSSVIFSSRCSDSGAHQCSTGSGGEGSCDGCGDWPWLHWVWIFYQLCWTGTAQYCGIQILAITWIGSFVRKTMLLALGMIFYWSDSHVLYIMPIINIKIW